MICKIIIEDDDFKDRLCLSDKDKWEKLHYLLMIARNRYCKKEDINNMMTIDSVIRCMRKMNMGINTDSLIIGDD